MKFKFDRWIMGAFLSAILLMAGLAYLTFQALDQQIETTHWVEHSQIVVDRLQAWLIAIGSGGAVLIVTVATVLLDRMNRARRRAEETVRLSERRMRLMIDSVKDYAIIMLDAGGHIVSWNSGAQRMKGYRAEQIIGRHFSILYPEEKVREGYPEREIEQTARVGRFEDEGWRLRADGSRFLANVVFTAVHDENGALFGFVKVTRDITEARKTDQHVRGLNEELAQRAAQLEASNKELEAFSYSVSHDLRSPLRHIAGFVEMLQKVPAVRADASSQRYCGVIAKAARQMSLLIDDLLAFSRAGRAEMYVTRLDMRRLVDQVIDELEMEWKGRKVTWDIGPLDAALADPQLLRLVWTNLISNALKYTRPREEARIEVGQVRTANRNGLDQKDELTFYVRDNGVGFDMEYRHKLFGVFQRLHRAEEFEGTGIGLANVQRIVHRHGGRVWAHGEVDAGAVFHFSLPNHHPSSATNRLPIPEPCLN